MVSLNLRLLPKLMKRGILGGSSKNHYLKGNVRKIDMNLIFPKEHWKVTEHDEYFSIELQNYTFIGGQLKRDALTLAQKMDAQTANYEKAKERLKKAKSTLKKASPMYKSAAKLNVDIAERNFKVQKVLLKEYVTKYEKQKDKAKKKVKPKVDE